MPLLTERLRLTDCNAGPTPYPRVIAVQYAETGLNGRKRPCFNVTTCSGPVFGRLGMH